MAKSRNKKFTPPVDYFHEHIETPYRTDFFLLGSHFRFESNDRRLIQLTTHAFEGIPKHSFPGRARRFSIKLILEGKDANPGWQMKGHSPVTNMYFWNGILCKTMGPDTVLIINPQTGSAQIVTSREMFALPYNLRYQLIEYAVVFLAHRNRGFTSLNGACVALKDKGVVLIGDNGAGKSTTSLACMNEGFEYVSEEGLVVHTTALLASGLPNFLHLRPDCLRFFKDLKRMHAKIKFPEIVRRSGVSKLEIDTRKLNVQLARSSVKISALVFLSGRKSGNLNLIKQLSRLESRNRLEKVQLNVHSSRGWQTYLNRLSGVPAYSITPGDHPKSTVAVLREILV